MRRIAIALVWLAACRSSKDEAAVPPLTDTAQGNPPVWIGIYYCSEGLVLGSAPPSAPLFDGPGWHESFVPLTESDLFTLYGALVGDGIKNERDRGPEVPHDGIPPATYTIVISRGPERIEARFYHVNGFQVPSRYLKEFEKLKPAASAPLFRTIRENHAALMRPP